VPDGVGVKFKENLMGGGPGEGGGGSRALADFIIRLVKISKKLFALKYSPN
jgi:hypothetical protein